MGEILYLGELNVFYNKVGYRVITIIKIVSLRNWMPKNIERYLIIFLKFGSCSGKEINYKSYCEKLKIGNLPKMIHKELFFNDAIL